MTSLSLRKKPKFVPSLASDYTGSDCSTEREGIFDQFSEDSSSELYYYAVHSSSDSEGNITVLDVKRERFDSDVKEIKRVKVDEEAEIADDKDLPHPKRIYGFRTRRFKKHRDDEFETSLCGTSDESGGEKSKPVASSDDETYDITADNWTFVRGAKKKTTDAGKKKGDSPKKNKTISPKKSAPLKIRLKSAFRRKVESKLQKMSQNFRKDGKNTLQTKGIIPSVENKVKKGSPNRITKSKTDTPSKSPAKETPVSFGKPQSLKTAPASGSLRIPNFPKKSPNRIRCGYNSTAPKNQEIRHIRRRQLRQTPSRTSQAGTSIYNEGSSSSEDDIDGETATAQGMRTRKISRIENESNVKGKTQRMATPPSGASVAPSRGRPSATPSVKETSALTESKTETSNGSVETTVPCSKEAQKNSDLTPYPSKTTQPSPRLFSKLLRTKSTSDTATKSMEKISIKTPSEESNAPSSETMTTATSNGNGLKLVIRRQSIDPPTHTVKAEGSPQRPKNAENGNKMREFSPGILGAKKFHISRVVKVKSSKQSQNNESKMVFEKSTQLHKPQKEISTERESPESSEKSKEVLERDGDKNSVKDSLINTDASAQKEPKRNRTCATNKTTQEDDATKKRKTKKKRKKDRGRSGSTAGAEAAFDAQHTAMRLAMELPRHNWLVNSLIKDKKLKAEDDKPLNNIPEGEEANSHTEENTTSKTQQQENSPQQVVAEGVNTPQTTHLTEDNPTPQGEESQPEDGRKHSNAVKGSFMVGIVKPFQHLRMSPSNMEAAEMSPPTLCIADEEDDGQNQGKENNSGPKTDPCGTPSKCGELPACRGMEISGKHSTCAEVPCTASCGQKTATTSTHEVVNAFKRRMPMCSSNSVTVNTVEVAQCEVKEPSKSEINANARFQQEEIRDGHVTSEVKGQSNAETIPESQEVDKANIETVSEINISNCFSLALDLTKKGDKIPVKKSPENDQPLDLSTGPKTIESPPKILDLSVKKPSTSSAPINEVPVPEKSLAIPQINQSPKSIVLQGESETQPQTTTTPKPATTTPKPATTTPKPATATPKPATTTPKPAKPPNETQAPQPKDNNVIVIDDDPSDAKKITGTQKTPLIQIQRVVYENRRLNTSPTSSGTSGAKQPPQMKRAASYDSTPLKDSLIALPPKRTRMSLDDANRRSVESRISPVQTAQNRPQQVQIAARHDAAKLLPEARTPYTNKGNRKGQTLAENNTRLNDLFPNKTQSFAPKLQNEHIPASISAPSSYPTALIRNTPPARALSQPASGQHYVPNSGAPSGDFNITNLPQNRLRINSNQTQVRTTRVRSLEGTNSTAQTVARAYQPDMRQLEPYIKEQQRVVDQKIQELEAIKRQLANASASVREDALPPPYPQRVSHVGGNMYAPPMPQRGYPSPILKKQSPPRPIPTRPMSQATIRPRLDEHYPIAPIHSLPMQQNAIVQSQYPRPASLPTNRVRPEIIGRHPVSQTRLTGPPTRRMQPPRTEPSMNPSHPVPVLQTRFTGPPPRRMQPSRAEPAMNPSHPAPVLQTRLAGPPPRRMLPPRTEPTMNPSHLAYQRALSNAGQPPISVNPHVIRHSQHSLLRQPVSTNQTPLFSRPSTTPSEHISNQIPVSKQIPVPVSYRQVPQMPNQRSQIQIPRVQAPTSAPVYRNGGLTVHETFKSRLNEPIIIEDDIIRSGGVPNPRKRPAQPEAGADSLHVRRTYSYHPPLSKNRMDQQGQIPQPTSNHWKGHQGPVNYKAPQQRPSVSEAQGEICVKCKRKAFFLCSGCRKVWYCSKECQVKDWSAHSVKCSG